MVIKMKSMRKTIAVLLTIAMAFSLCGVVSFAATAEDVWQYETYTSLGDSAVAGYGLPGWEEMKREYAVWGDEAVNMDVRDAIASLNSLQDAENALVEGTPEYAAMFAVLKQQKLEELGDNLASHWHATDFTRLHEVEGTYASLIAKAVGAPENLIPYCVEYGRILAVCMPFYMLNGAFHPLLITANQPGLGLLVSILNAAINIVLDWVAIAILGWGLKGAALATGLAWIISAMVPLYYFAKKSQALRFGPFRFDAKDLGQTCYNGSSEMADAISYALVAMLFNGQLLRYAGEAGVDAYAVSEYVGGIFLAIFFGISMSMTPVVGFHLGQGNKTELRSIRKNGTLVMGALGIAMAAVSYGFAAPIAYIFVGYDQTLTDLSVEALRIIAFSYLLGGVTTFYSAFFTGMGDGTASLAVAVVKSFAFPVAGLLLLPLALGRIGIWLVTPLAEIFAMLTAVFFLLRYRKKQIL